MKGTPTLIRIAERNGITAVVISVSTPETWTTHFQTYTVHGNLTQSCYYFSDPAAVARFDQWLEENPEKEADLTALADELDDAAGADIWYDADDYNDASAFESIERAQSAMSRAADILRKNESGISQVELDRCEYTNSDDPDFYGVYLRLNSGTVSHSSDHDLYEDALKAASDLSALHDVCLVDTSKTDLVREVAKA